MSEKQNDNKELWSDTDVVRAAISIGIKCWDRGYRPLDPGGEDKQLVEDVAYFEAHPDWGDEAWRGLIRLERADAIAGPDPETFEVPAEDIAGLLIQLGDIALRVRARGMRDEHARIVDIAGILRDTTNWRARVRGLTSAPRRVDYQLPTEPLLAPLERIATTLERAAGVQEWALAHPPRPYGIPPAGPEEGEFRALAQPCPRCGCRLQVSAAEGGLGDCPGCGADPDPPPFRASFGEADHEALAELRKQWAAGDRRYEEHLKQMRDVEDLIRPECRAADAGYPASRNCVEAALRSEPCCLHTRPEPADEDPPDPGPLRSAVEVALVAWGLRCSSTQQLELLPKELREPTERLRRFSRPGWERRLRDRAAHLDTEALLDEPPSKWISVADRLPDPAPEAVFAWRRGALACVAMFDGSRFLDVNCAALSEYPVTHWQRIVPPAPNPDTAATPRNRPSKPPGAPTPTSGPSEPPAPPDGSQAPQRAPQWILDLLHYCAALHCGDSWDATYPEACKAVHELGAVAAAAADITESGLDYLHFRPAARLVRAVLAAHPVTATAIPSKPSHLEAVVDSWLQRRRGGGQ